MSGQTFPPCNKCGQIDWKLLEHRVRDDGFIDFYRCVPCSAQIPEKGWVQVQMCWGYDRPEDALFSDVPRLA